MAAVGVILGLRKGGATRVFSKTPTVQTTIDRIRNGDVL